MKLSGEGSNKEKHASVFKVREAARRRGQLKVKDLVALAKRGDREAMEELIRRELPWVRGLISGYVQCPEAVDDLCQEVFISVWKKIRRLRREETFRAWLYRIVLNRVRSYLRRRRRVRENPLPEEEEVPIRDRSQEELEKQEIMNQALSSLPSEYRDPLLIHYFQGKSTSETAAILGLQPVTARIRLMRARRMLGRLLRERGFFG